MNDKLKQQIAMITNNTVRMGFFVILAVIFNKWWIVLCSPLFFVRVEE